MYAHHVDPADGASVFALKDRNSTLFGDEQRGRGGGGGVIIINIDKNLEKKNHRDIYNTKRVDMPNFSRFGATWKIATKLSFRAGLHGATQLLSPVRYTVPKTTFKCFVGQYHFHSTASGWSPKLSSDSVHGMPQTSNAPYHFNHCE